jgi:hypothetical protein
VEGNQVLEEIQNSSLINISKQRAKGWGRIGLSFVAVWALFRIELISGHSEDVVALDADAMDVAGYRLGGLSRTFGWNVGVRGDVTHGGILSRVASPRGGIQGNLNGHQKVQEQEGSVWRNGVTS